MSGEDLKNKLDEAGISQAEIARRLGVIPSSVWQSLSAKDVKTGFLESICDAFELDITFFYGGKNSSKEDIQGLKDYISHLKTENEELRRELRLKEDPERYKKESEMYRLWMKQMEITERMQELYQKQKEK